MKSDGEISKEANLKDIETIAKKLGLKKDDIEVYGKYKAKLSLKKMYDLQKSKKKGKLILVTAITPTPAGEGKTTVTIGLADGLNKIGKKACAALREPSLGPCFGIKGGACGGGYSQMEPMEDINLHFNGDIHAITAANNLISALVDNHMQKGNALRIDPKTIQWRRCLDLNDRELRNATIGLGEKSDGIMRQEHFNISVASEIMAILCLSQSIDELKERIDNIYIGDSYDGKHIYFSQFGYTGAIAALLKDAIKPNIVQTLENTPVFVHGGPFANIAHGCNSINATISALGCSDYVVTEAGFAADLGAEKFMDIKCRDMGIYPSCVVLVATIRALKMHAGVKKECLDLEDTAAVENGCKNLKVHIENINKFGGKPVVVLNKFSKDTDDEINVVKSIAESCGCRFAVSTAFEDGGNGAKEFAKVVVEECGKYEYHSLYDTALPIKDKICLLAKEIYRASSCTFTKKALDKIKEYDDYSSLPVCVAKTQNSITHDPKMLNVPPMEYSFPITDIRLYSGAEFIVALAGDIMTMPGLPKDPAAANIDIDNLGNIIGLS